MSNHSTSASASRLRNHIASLQTMTRFVLATLALASGVYTYLGVRGLLDGSATLVFLGAIIYSVAVSVGIYGFWTYLIRFVPEMRDGASRVALFLIMIVGSAMIIAMSSWLNAAALAGSAAVEQHLATTQQEYTADLDQAHSNALGALSLLPDIQRAQERFARLAEDERASGALTGTSGSGSVVQLLTQMSAQMNELQATIEGSRERVQTLFEEGQLHLTAMRQLVSASGPVEPRANEFAQETVALSGVIASLEQTSIAPSVARAAQDLSMGFIAPVASGADADLAGRQSTVMETVRASVGAQSAALSEAANEILAQPRVDERRFVPLSSAEAVLVYATSFLPSWAGAISIDLLPGVFVAVMAVVMAALRRHEEGLSDADRITAADMLRSIELHETLAAARAARQPVATPEAEPPPAETRPAAQASPPTAQSNENVTPLSLNERKRFEP